MSRKFLNQRQSGEGGALKRSRRGCFKGLKRRLAEGEEGG